MTRPITKDRIVELLREGWQLGVGSGVSSHAWMQKELMHGGDTYDCNYGSVNALRKRKIIRFLPARKKDPFWLSRYELTELK